MSEERPCLFCGETVNVRKTPDHSEFTFSCVHCKRRYVVSKRRILQGISPEERPAFEKLVSDANAKGRVAQIR